MGFPRLQAREDVNVVSYYSVVAGWTIRYTLLGVQNGYATDPDAASAQFADFATGPDAVFFHALFALSVTVVIGAGIKRGLELVVKVLVPAIVVVILGLTFYAATLTGSGEAYAYYLAPDLDLLVAEWTSIVPAAAGQAFFTLSLGFGGMITYASYLGHDQNLVEDGAVIVSFDTAIAVLTGLIVFPILFTAGVDPGDPGPGAIFVSLAAALGDLSFGWLLGMIFFGTVVVAAFSSAINLLEIVVSYVVDERDVPRPYAAALVGGGVFLLGIPSAADLMLLNFFDGMANQVLLVLCGLLLMLFVGWQIPTVALEELQSGTDGLGHYGTAWIWAIRVPVVLVLFVALALGIVGYAEFLAGPFGEWLDGL